MLPLSAMPAFSWSQVARALFCIVLSVLIAVPIQALRRKLRIARGLAPLQGPKGVFLLGNIPNFIRNKNRIYHFLEERLREYGGIMKMPWHLFFDGAIYITDPEHVKHVLSTNFENYVKPQGFTDAFQEVFEHSFFAMNHHAHTPDKGEKWRLQRKVAAKVFTATNFKMFTEKVFDKYAQSVIAVIEAQDSQCDMQELCAQYTLQSIFDIAFGIPLQDVVDPQAFATSMNFVNEHCASRLFVKQYYKLFAWCMPSEYRLKRETDFIRGIADKILLRRLQESEQELAERFDILSLFIKKARELDEDSASLLCLDTLRSIILTFIFAGRDTTAECITYTFYGIARHPEVQQKIVDELLSCNKDSSLNYDDMKCLRYLEAVVYEAVRLYPALPYNVKMAVNDDQLPDGTFVPAGTDVVYSPWYMGRNNPIWGSDPLAFRPERWLEMKTRPSAFEFPAFQAGPRICIGMNMAVLEAKMFIAVMLRHFHVEIPDHEKQERGYLLKSGLFMDGGLPLEMIARGARAFSYPLNPREPETASVGIRSSFGDLLSPGQAEPHRPEQPKASRDFESTMHRFPFVLALSLDWSQVVDTLAVLAITWVFLSFAGALQRKLRIAKGLAAVPGPKGTLLLGILPQMAANIHRFYHFQEDLMKQYGGRMKLPWNIFFDSALYIASPEDVQHVLSINFGNYIKPQAMLDAFKELYEDSLFFVNHAHCRDNGERWTVLRKVSTKVFTTSNFRVFSRQIFYKYAASDTIGAIETQGGKCNMLHVARQFTLRSIFDIGCGIPLANLEDPDAFANALDGVNEHGATRLLLKRHYKLFWWCMPSEYKLKRDVSVVTSVAEKIVRKRLAEPSEVIAKRSDILSLFIMKARELEDAPSWMLEFTTLRSVLMTFVLAGRDTTSSAITYVFYEIVRHPEVQEKIVKELCQLGTSDLDYDDMKRLPYIDAVLNETLRLNPPVPFDIKVAAEDDHLPDGTFVPAGTEIFFSPWYMGRNNSIWGNDPLVFRPERWLEMKTRPSAYENPVFQAGPRICIGMSMALLEAKMFIAVMLRHFHVELQDGEGDANRERPYALNASLMLDGGLPLKMTPREARPC